MKLYRNIIFLILIAAAIKGLLEDRQFYSDIPIAINYGKAAPVYYNNITPYSHRIGSFEKSLKYTSSTRTQVVFITQIKYSSKRFELAVPKLIHAFIFCLSSVNNKIVNINQIPDGLKGYIVHFMRC